MLPADVVSDLTADDAEDFLNCDASTSSSTQQQSRESIIPRPQEARNSVTSPTVQL